MLTSAIWSGWKVGIVQCHGVYSVIFAFDNRQRKSQYKVRTTCTSPVDVGHVGVFGLSWCLHPWRQFLFV
jgi:hypothetical protein